MTRIPYEPSGDAGALPLEQIQERAAGNDRHAPELPERLQLAIAGDEVAGPGRDGGGEDEIVRGMGRHAGDDDRDRGPRRIAGQRGDG